MRIIDRMTYLKRIYMPMHFSIIEIDITAGSGLECTTAIPLNPPSWSITIPPLPPCIKEIPHN